MNRTMHRTTIVALAVVAMALLLVGGVVLAKSISCTAGVTCNGNFQPMPRKSHATSTALSSRRRFPFW